MTTTLVRVGMDKTAAAAWVDLPRAVYSKDERWVPPLRSDALRALDPRKNSLYRHAQIEHFLLYDRSVVVGRIAASIHSAYNERCDARTGFFGFFECEQREEYAAELLRAAEGWVAQRGMKRIAGPYNYFSGQEMGVLVSGFDSPPCAFQTHNPPGYAALLESSGYARDVGAATYRVGKDIVREHSPAVLASSDALRERLGLTIRPFNKRRFSVDMETLRQLFNESFAGNHEVLPYAQDVFADMVAPLRRLVDDQLIRFVERDGEPIAFVAAIPDINQVLSVLDGKVRIMDLLRLPGLLRRVDTAVILLVGALPTAAVGVGQVLLTELARAVLDSRYREVRTTWVHQENRAIHALMRQWGAVPDKRYAIYAKDLVTR